MKSQVESCHLTKFDAFRVNRDQAMVKQSQGGQSRQPKWSSELVNLPGEQPLMKPLNNHTNFLSVLKSSEPPLVKTSEHFSHYKHQASSKIKKADWLVVSILSNTDSMDQPQQ